MTTKEPRMIFGFVLLALLSTLAAVVALGRVHQESSYGLDYILGSLATLSGGFAQWAFGHAKPNGDKKEGE
jgi:hypothetical protein